MNGSRCTYSIGRKRERWSPGYYSPSVVRTMGEDERLIDYPGFLPFFLPFLTSTDEKKKHVLRLIGRFTLSLSLSLSLLLLGSF